jgi:methylated-DNA-[protein]-cysteine S-methyltransferase
MTVTSLTLESPIGPLRLEARGDALCALHLPNATAPDVHARGRGGVLAEAARQMRAYFAGTLQAFDLPLAPDGTDFQRGVWRALVAIPYAATCSYGDIARVIGSPTASRAVGAANGRNPIAIIVPCHRVIGSTGALTGYGGGMPAKRWLLAHEATIAGRQSSLALA